MFCFLSFCIIIVCITWTFPRELGYRVKPTIRRPNSTSLMVSQDLYWRSHIHFWPISKDGVMKFNNSHGSFLALTPSTCYSHPQAFPPPTTVNVLSQFSQGLSTSHTVNLLSQLCPGLPTSHHSERAVLVPAQLFAPWTEVLQAVFREIDNRHQKFWKLILKIKERRNILSTFGLLGNNI